MKNDKERIKELILTDYLDDQMDERQRRKLEAQIEADPELKAFLLEARRTVQEPFEQQEQPTPPDYLWHRIKERITSGEQEAEFSFIEKMRHLWKRPRFAIAGVSLVVIALVALIGSQVYLRSSLRARLISEKQVEYLALLMEDDFEMEEDEQQDFDTSIERMFL